MPHDVFDMENAVLSGFVLELKDSLTLCPMLAFNASISLLSFVLTFISCLLIYVFIEILIKKCHNYRVNKILKMLF